MLGNKIEQMYRAQLFARADDTGVARYFSAADFEGLSQTPFPFTASAGHRLQGYFYTYPNPIPGRIVVFDHGMGGGHRSYMREIERLARHGYRVFAYDHTGCMESQGSGTNGFAQSLRDLNDALTALKGEPSCAGCGISVMGHSWGAFSNMNIAALHPDVRHVVALSGFASVERILRSMFGKGIAKLFFKRLWRVEQTANSDFVGYDAAQTLKHVDVPTLLIYSADDPIVHAADHYEVLRQALDGKENVRLLLVEGKGHNPNYTADAVRYKDGFFADLTKRMKKKALESDLQKKDFIASYDWNRMTAQDEKIWKEIFSTLGE